ncbi:hypothetical protein V6N13_086833 [Hibiscus sabdariffa]|uniref:Uncharacterized protein n=1 Tax=Hibiscus sabdariffa TaxID=183260 RepID=A0ABR2FUE5_9ROSI
MKLPVVSFHTKASLSPAVPATLSHVAHAEELPMLAPLFGGQPTRLPVSCPSALQWLHVPKKEVRAS